MNRHILVEAKQPSLFPAKLYVTDDEPQPENPVDFVSDWNEMCGKDALPHPVPADTEVKVQFGTRQLPGKMDGFDHLLA